MVAAEFVLTVVGNHRGCCVTVNFCFGSSCMARLPVDKPVLEGVHVVGKSALAFQLGNVAYIGLRHQIEETPVKEVDQGFYRSTDRCGLHHAADTRGEIHVSSYKTFHDNIRADNDDLCIDALFFEQSEMLGDKDGRSRYVGGRNGKDHRLERLGALRGLLVLWIHLRYRSLLGIVTPTILNLTVQ